MQRSENSPINSKDPYIKDHKILQKRAAVKAAHLGGSSIFFLHFSLLSNPSFKIFT